MGDFYNKNGFGRQASFPLTFFCSWVINIGTSGILKGTLSSFQLLFAGYFLALALAIPSALVIGWKKRLTRL